MAQTKATDEMFGTQTYEAYCNAVLPQLVRSDKARSALPRASSDAVRQRPASMVTRHEIYDEILAFTFGHELAHHYLGHTGCAKGRAARARPDEARSHRDRRSSLQSGGEASADSAGAYKLARRGARAEAAIRVVGERRRRAARLLRAHRARGRQAVRSACSTRSAS